MSSVIDFIHRLKASYIIIKFICSYKEVENKLSVRFGL
ncbi:hypothetical protein EMUCRT_0698 [Ehrlichia cf. muris str. EmCRT]|uniref:Uncharacterized protein n=1 Tax=Ehrlichia cf. muris str. EmCRT TaxID=1359167 RepID=A0A0F3NDF5_9RICK|nr:hypothetical protein EMUCRT_0698 [Ehrlichia cf. muris str. EmCRT]